MDSKHFWQKTLNEFPKPKQTPLIEGCFLKKGSFINNKRYFKLYEDSLYYFEDEKSDQPKGYCVVDFDLNFQIITKKENDFKSPLKGFIFYRNNLKMEINSNDEALLQKWREILAKRINQRGFHEQYKAVRKIGVGNFASVYLAEKLENQKHFAVKAFPKKRIYEEEENGKESLVNEIDLMRSVDHKNVICLYEVFETDNSLYIVLELLEGGSLFTKLKQKHKYSNEEVKYMMKGLLEGIASMHARNIMHRDLKPENIMFRSENSLDLVIADLGLGTKQDVAKYLYVRCGTPGFVAPEVINIMDFSQKYDLVCDVFSLGVIFHILLIGKSPFPGKTYEEILNQNREANIIFQGKEYLKLTLQAYDLLKKMLETDPKQRISAQKALQHEYFTENKVASISEIGAVSDSPIPSPQILVTKGQNMVRDSQGMFKVRTDEQYNEGFYSPSIGIDQKQIQQMNGQVLEGNNQQNYDDYCEKKSNMIRKNLKTLGI